MKFSRAEIKSFAEISKDFNPLHLDDSYSRQTPYGEVAVHGGLIILCLLKSVASRNTRFIRRIRAQFYRPLFPDIEFRIQTEEWRGGIGFSLYCGSTIHCHIAFQFGKEKSAGPSHIFEHKNHTKGTRRLRGQSYSLGSGSSRLLEKILGFKLSPLLHQQLLAICWASYFVGMKVPGQGTLSRLDLSFLCRQKSRILRIEDIRVSEDPRFRLWNIFFKSIQGLEGEILCFGRMPKSRVGGEAIRSIIKASRLKLRGQSVIVTGGSRGLGQTLATLCRVAGGTVKTISLGAGEKGMGEYRCDLTEISDVRRLVRDLKKRLSFVDKLILNAYSPSYPLEYLAWSGENWSERLLADVNLTHNLLHELVKAGIGIGHVILISSVHVSCPKAGLSEYVVGKVACEKLVECYALENKGASVSILRLPPFLSDRTNFGVRMPGLVGLARAAKWVGRELARATKRPFVIREYK